MKNLKITLFFVLSLIFANAAFAQIQIVGNGKSKFGTEWPGNDYNNEVTYEFLVKFKSISPWLQSCNPTGNMTTFTAYVPVDEASDGIVVESSAKNFPQGSSALPTKAVEMTGSNHQQMRNDGNTKNRLIELFQGEHGQYFRTN